MITRPFFRLLAICGSLRSGSSNEKLLLAASELGIAVGFEVRLYQGMAGLPHFNPDLDTDKGSLLPPTVVELRRAVGEADGLLISSPEYAHGIPGSLKNLLDWLVASTEFPGKPVALISGGEFAPKQLEETLRTMSARLVGNEIIPGAVLRKAFGSGGNLVDERLNGTLREILSRF
jgi:chromate reductase